MAIAGKNSNIKASGNPVNFLGEAFTTSDNKTYRITNVTKRVFSPLAAIMVYEAGVPTLENYTINRLTGTITFELVDAGRGAVTADGQYLPLTTVAEAREFTYTISGDNQDSTIFGDEFIERKQGLLDFSGSVGRFKDVDTQFFDLINAGTLFVFEFFTNAVADPDIIAWGLLSSDEISSSVDGLVEDSLEFEGAMDIDNRVIHIQKLGYEIP